MSDSVEEHGAFCCFLLTLLVMKNQTYLVSCLAATILPFLVALHLSFYNHGNAPLFPVLARSLPVPVQ